MTDELHNVQYTRIDNIIQGWKRKIEQVNKQETDGGLGTAVRRIWLPPSEENPYTYDEPLRRDNDKIVSRSHVLRTIKRCWSGDHIQSMNITGSVLSGKTSLLLAAADSHQSKIQLAYLSLEHLSMDGPGIVRISFALYDLLIESMHEQEIENDRIKYEPYRVLESLIRQVCKTNKELRKSFILVLDDFDHVEQVIETSVFERFLRFLHYQAENIPNFGLVIIGNVGGGVLYQQVKAVSSRSTTSILVAPISTVDLDALVSFECSKFPYRFDAEAIDYINQLTNGNPYLIQVIARHVLDGYARGYSNRNRKRKKADMGDASPYFMEPAVKCGHCISFMSRKHQILFPPAFMVF